VDSGEKPLYDLEALYSFQLHQRITPLSSSVPPPFRDRSDGFGDVPHFSNGETALGQEALIAPHRREQKEADRAPGANLLVGQLPRHHGRIGKEEATARAKHTIPVPQNLEPAREVID
jgi:hypothetical protein